MERIIRDWIVDRVLSYEKEGLEEEDLSLVYNLLESVSSDELFGLLTLYQKVRSNPNTLNQIRKNLGVYRPKSRNRSRPHRSQRKRGYTDKGSLPDPQQTVLRRIVEEDLIHIRILDDLTPNLLLKIETLGRGRCLEGDYVLLSELKKFIELLQEEGVWNQTLSCEVSELSDLVRSAYGSA